MTFLLDTNTVSYFLRDYSAQLSARLLASPPDALAISNISAGELAYGVEKLGTSHRASVLAGKLGKLLQTVSVLPVLAEAAQHYAKIRVHLESQGTPISGNDLWIASHALALDIVLVTNNTREFSRVLGLKVENWL